ncbi:AIPR family protein [Embleya scabrispora]|uniref:AIPR family protein n=1 Tax=Embleya scabrispora TaxID=159449 RepID=UPI000382BD73|nr:AIPR family protein [Embleya scabrispora]MYS81059.1 hypothetical protein [Streptomyces sp. SID5474]
MPEPEWEGFARSLEAAVVDRVPDESAERRRNAFLEVVCDYLVNDGVVEDVTPCYLRKQVRRRTLEVHGYEISDGGTSLDLFIVRADLGATALARRDVQTAFNAVEAFAEECAAGTLAELEDTSPQFDMADTVHKAWPGLTRMRVFLLTDGRTTLAHVDAKTVAGLPTSYELWDIARLFRLATSGRQQEQIVIDLADFGGPVPCLPALRGGEYHCLLAVLPGQLLADLYDTYGGRLLQRNVRAYLQARGKVNKAISQTVREAPGRFLAYNNGISATATDVGLEEGPDGQIMLARLVDLQIVNGGQTTASLHHTSLRDRADLADVRVPAKFTIVQEADALDEFVPKISKYANSQNIIREADFEANSPFHVELERLSRALWAPAVGGSTRQTRWYYERVRGQYQVALSEQRTEARKRQFRQEHPPAQRFGKTEVAKYEMLYLRHPHLVSRGGQKCFQIWTSDVVSAYASPPSAAYFRELVAKSILFEESRKLIRALSAADDHQGYLAQLTNYVVALLVDRAGGAVDLDRVWKSQSLPEHIAALLPGLLASIRPILTHPPGGANVTEWCKKEECWKTVVGADWGLPPTFLG